MAVSDLPPTIEQVLAADERRGAEMRVIDESGGLRLDAVRDEALEYGVRSGLARRAYEIQILLKRQAPELDRIFDFNSLLMDQNVLPPVLTEARQVVQTNGAEVIRITDQIYTIAEQARFVTVAPTWRNYLLATITYTYTPPDPYLRPRTEAESDVWQMAVKRGWGAGVQQADQIFAQSLGQLTRDYKGMVLYRTLLTRGMVSRPFVAEAHLGITGDGDRVNINERVLRITALPQLQPTSKWKPIPVPAKPMTSVPVGGRP